MSLLAFPRQFLVDTNGSPRVGAKAYVYEPGSSTPISIYTTASFSVELPNPVSSLEGGVFPAIYVNHAVNPAYKLLITDADDVALYSDDNIPAVEPVVIETTDAEDSANVTPVNYAHQPYVRGRYGNFNDWKLACDEAGAEGQLEADYAITSAIDLPNKSNFNGYKITGAFDVVHGGRNGGYVRQWRSKQVVIRGSVFSQYTGIDTEFEFPPEDTGSILIDGGVSIGESGTEECDIEIVYTRRCTVTNDNGYINFNRIHGSGKALYVHFTGTHISNEMHANLVEGLNVFKNGSGSEWGLVNDCTVQQTNYAKNIYFEGGSNIVGPWHVLFYQGDALGMPAISRFHHILGTVGVSERLSRDFLSLSVHNCAVGGMWDILDSSGKPPCLSNSGGASVSVVTDTGEPTGTGLRYEAAFADASDQFQIAIQPSGSSRFGITIFYKSTADFVAFESVADAVTTSHDVTAVADPSGSNWKMLRICGTASLSTATVVKLIAYAGVGGATKTMSIGGIFAGGERAIVSPQRPTTRYRYGSATYDPASLADGAGATTTVSVTGAALGDLATASFSLDLQGITLTAWVSAANTVSVRFQNESGGVLDLGSGTLRVQTQTPYA